MAQQSKTDGGVQPTGGESHNVGTEIIRAQNGGRGASKRNASQTNGTTTNGLNQVTQKALVHIEPFRLWNLKVLRRFQIITKSEMTSMLEQYLDSLNKIRANISKESEVESDEYLESLEPTNWKEQDHYLVLGLQHLRYRATEDDIRRAHRRKALKHHPDKRGKKATDLTSDYYSCITRAMDILSDPIKRRSYDSVDPTFDDSIPAQIKAQRLEQDPTLFYRTFKPAFENNARWAIKPEFVPQLGNDSSSREHVENFYEYWYNFQSWREFSYLDEEDKEKGENRDERRWLDKQNKAARLQRKKAESIRIRHLVDNAYNCDPRIVRFKEEDKQKKLNIKKAKQDEIRQRHEREAAERSRIEEEERQKKLAAEEEEKQKKLEAKKLKESAKKETKKVVKGLESIFKENEYFAANPKEKIKHIEELDKLTKMLSLDEVREFKSEMEQNQEFTIRQKLFKKRLDRVHGLMDEEKRQQLAASNSNSSPKSPSSKSPPWSEEEIKLLVKSVSTFPAGTKDRWEVIAKYMAQHSPSQVQRDAKQVLSKVKQIQEQLAKRR